MASESWREENWKINKQKNSLIFSYYGKPPISFQIISQMKDEKKYKVIDGGGLGGVMEG